MKRSLSASAAAAGALMGFMLPAGPASAAQQDLELTAVTPALIEVTGADGKYTSVKGPALTAAADLYLNGGGGSTRIESWRLWLRLKAKGLAGTGDLTTVFKPFSLSQTYPAGALPFVVDEELDVTLPKPNFHQYAIVLCNKNADTLKAGLLSEQNALSKDYEIGVEVEVLGEAEYTVQQDTSPTFQSGKKSFTIVCKGQEGSPQTVLSPNAPLVKNVKLALNPRTHRGSCPVNVKMVMTFEGDSPGVVHYRIVTSDKRIVGGNRKATMTVKPGGQGARAVTTEKLRVPLVQAAHWSTAGGGSNTVGQGGKPGGLNPAIAGQGPTGLTDVPTPDAVHKLGLRVEMLGGSKVKSNWQTYIIDCRAPRPGAGAPGGFKPVAKPSADGGSASAGPYLPDLAVSETKKSFKPFELLVQVQNLSFFPSKATQLRATYKQGGANKQKVTVQVPALKTLGSAWVTVTFKTQVAQADSIHVQLDPNNTMKEAKENNNTAVYQP
ncbi:CARDB domain-containing protein [Pelagibius sp.]|uniref:CARDB domain-containing protein n=1 Tax=Pelagibius sp. TaxID=1931238 RepID=UPI00261C5220|nr:CARDB domain-containing protein [Pelagibius sp.]